jgi:L-aspartate oxidase
VTAALRHLPAVRPRWRSGADVVIVGSGAAGIAAALAAAAHGRQVLMVTKDLTGGATPLAQGGMAAAIGPGDSAARHARDTIDAGAGLCEPETVTALAAGAPAAISLLAGLGARLEQVSLRLEGGHSRHRIVHSGDDATGAEVHRVLREALLASPVEILDSTAALDLLLTEEGVVGGEEGVVGGEGGVVGGLLAATIGSGGELDPGVVTAGSVVLAAGGLGQAFDITTNPPGATGDALALAARAGARLRDPEFVQFHPTVLWQQGTGQRPLITEALRGAGAVLRDLDGRPLMAGRHPLGDLAPRDVVSVVMQERIDACARHLWLDATALGADVLETGFPTVTAACRARGIDPVTEFIPVAPGAHYSCGGIQADPDGCTSVPGLYAVGEAASTGLHGANRLASNSLTEAVIAGRRAGRAGEVPGALGSARPSGTPLPPPPGIGVSAASRPALAAAMSRYAGVLRDRAGLDALLRAARKVPGARGETAGSVRAKDLDLATVEATNLHAVSVLVATAALWREESRGCHRRRDVPWTWPDPRHSVLRWDGDGLHAVADAPVGAAS